MPSRRDLLAAGAGALAAMAGCAGDSTGTAGSATGADDDRPTPTARADDGDRPTATARDPEPLEVAGEWPQRGGGPGHPGATDAVGAPTDGRVHWALRRVRSGPAVVSGGRLFHYAKLGEDRGGRPTLTRTREPDAGTAHPVYGVPSLVAREAGTGELAWARRLPDPGVGTPAVAGGTVVATVEGRVLAHDAADGTELWAHTVESQPTGAPTVTDDVVVVPLDGVVGGDGGDPARKQAIRAFDVGDGSERWTAGAPWRETAVAVADDAVLVLSHDFDGSGVLQSRGLAGGAERWRVALSGEFSFRGPVVASGLAYVAGSDGVVRAFDVTDGAERWSAPGGADGVAAGRGLVAAAGDGALVVRDAADGSERWRRETEAESLTAPAVGGEAVYAGGNWTDLVALDPADGTERWARSFPTQTVEGDMVMRGLAAQPAVVDGGLFAYAVDGLYAFGPA